ncbi:MAG: beta-ketoacyl-[acyl-carrier-protein] synthase family protein [Pseudomonadota bacterium]
MSRRVVITGQGAICALGRGADVVQNAMVEGQIGIAPMDFPDVERLHVNIGAQIKDYDSAAHFTKQQISLYDPFTQFALLAAQEAIDQSGLAFEGHLAESAGVILGTAGGGLQTQEENYRNVFLDGKNRVHPFVVPRLMNNSAASHISMTHNLMGPSFTVASACASSNHAIAQATDMVRLGHCDAMVTGGSDSMLCFGGIKAWEGLRVMSKDGCRPFCATRNGMVQGEGAAIFVIEEYQHARARGADILAEIAGSAMSSDASDIVTPNQDGAERAMRGALRSAKVNPDDIGYINAHGTGTTANDKTEIAAIKSVFGAAAAGLRVSSTKSMHGHLIGGTGAVELLAIIKTLRDGVVPPTVGYQKADPDCDLNIVPNVAQAAKVKAALSNAFAFGGLNAVLALRAT